MTKKQRKEVKKGLRSGVALAALQRSGAGPMGDRRCKRQNRRSWRKEEADA